MKKYIILTIIFVLLLSFGIFIAYRVGFNQGYNHTVPAVEMCLDQGLIKKDDIPDFLWWKNARCRDFGNYFLLKPNDDSIDSLWIVPKDKSSCPVIYIEKERKGNISKGGEGNVSIVDKNKNQIIVGYSTKENQFTNLSSFSNEGYLIDFNLNGTWDTCSKKQKNGYYRAIQIDSVWYKYTYKKNKIKGEKNYIYINTKDGKKEVLRDDGDYYIKSEQD